MSASDATDRRRGTFLAETLANERLCDEHYLLRLALPAFPPTVPGQFVQVQCRPPTPHAPPQAADWPADRPPQLTHADLRTPEPLLRRPFSLAGRRDAPGGAVELEIIYRVVGSGTGWLERLGAAAPVSVLGPLGNGFAVREDKPAAVLVGGGVGIPPMIYLGQALSGRGKRVKAFCGVRSGHLLPLRLTGEAEASELGSPTLCAAEFAAHGIETAIATDDGSLGWKGFAPGAFEQWLAGQDAAAAELVVYACGPEPMMRAVGAMCTARGIECQLALERHMGCGMGTCQSCVVKVRTDDEQGWRYRLVCTDGPVFDAASIVWD